MGGKVKNLFSKCKILGTGCFVKDTPVLIAGTSHSISLRNTFPAYALAALPLVSPVPIQNVSLLDYAVTHKSVNAASISESNASSGLTANAEDTYIVDTRKVPSRSQDLYTSEEQRLRDQYEIDEDNWHEVAFEEVNGTSTCRLALHNDWIINHGYAVDGIVAMNLPEQGISGPFKITSIKHIIPQKKPVDEDPDDEWEYKPVTGLFTHLSDQVHTLAFASADGSQVDTLGVTAAHPIFSATHQDWRLAGELEAGEKVLTYYGEATVLSNDHKPGNEHVYNLEVKDFHNFLVGDRGVVVHNACARSILGDDLYRELKEIYQRSGKSADEIEELLEEAAQLRKEIAIELGEKVKSGISNALKQAAQEFEDYVKGEFISALLQSDPNIDPNSVVRQVTMNINGENVVFDYVALDSDGESLHFGEAKYSESDKDWETQWKKTTTPHQTNQFEKLNKSGTVIEVRCSAKCQEISAKLNLSHKQKIAPTKVKSLRIFGSFAKSKSVKTRFRII